MPRIVSIFLALLVFLLAGIFPASAKLAKAEQSGAVWVPPIDESFSYDTDRNRQNSSEGTRNGWGDR